MQQVQQQRKSRMEVCEYTRPGVNLFNVLPCFTIHAVKFECLSMKRPSLVAKNGKLCINE